MSESGNKKPKYLAYLRVATKEQLESKPEEHKEEKEKLKQQKAEK